MRKRWGHDEQGGLAPAYLLFLITLAAGLVLFMQVGHATVLGTEARTAADAAALAGAENLRDQILGQDVSGPGIPLTVDRGRVCAVAGDYASRNGASLVPGSCRVGTMPGNLYVQVEVRGHDGVIDGPIDDIGEARPGAEARAEISIDVSSVWGGGSGAPTNASLDESALGDEYRDRSPDERLAVVAHEANRIANLGLPYVWGGGHSTPAPRNGPYDCSSAVSALLQTIYPEFPTLTSGSFKNVGAPGTGSGKGVVIYAWNDGNAGHVFVTVGGRGWGTTGPHGPRWLPYNTPYGPYQWEARHIPALEPDDPTGITDLLNSFGITPGDGGGLDLGSMIEINLVPVEA